MRVVITGAAGQLGLDLLDEFADHEVVGLAREDLDVSVEAAVHEALDRLAPSLVINAAAWTDVDGCESDPERAHAVNALGPWWLARACLRLNATLVTVSTEHIFSGPAPRRGDEPRGWTEFDELRPANVYGASKAAGEQLVRACLPQHHIVRTSWVAGARGNNFVTAILRAARTREHLEVVEDEIGAPTYSRDLARALREVGSSTRYGTWNRTNAGSTSRAHQARTVLKMAGIATPVKGTSSADSTRPAARPAWSMLDATHVTACGFTPMPPWQDGLARLLTELGEVDARGQGEMDTRAPAEVDDFDGVGGQPSGSQPRSQPRSRDR